MTFVIWCAAILVALGIIVAVGRRFVDPADIDTSQPDCGTCSGSDDKCEQVCMMEAATRPIEYFDDEELDRYRGRRSDSYTDDEAEEFGEVMYTMQPGEVRDWNRSLALRGIEVPDQIKDELMMLIER